MFLYFSCPHVKRKIPASISRLHEIIVLPCTLICQYELLEVQLVRDVVSQLAKWLTSGILNQLHSFKLQLEVKTMTVHLSKMLNALCCS